MKNLKFQPHLVPLILSGKKRITWRLFDDKDIKKDDYISFLNSDTTEKFAQVKVNSVYSKKLKDIDKADFKGGHKVYSSRKKMYDAYNNLYGNRVTPETEVKIIEFELVNNKGRTR